MKAIKFTIILFLSFTYLTQAQNKLTINNLETAPGDNTNIKIELDNTDFVSGFQIKLKVPASLKVDEKEAHFVGRESDHIIYPKALGSGEYLFLCFSGTNANFTGQSGSLIEIPIEIPPSYSPGETYPMTFTEVILSSSNGEDIGNDHQNGKLTIIEGETPDLKVDSITTLQNDISPNELCNISWNVQNIGLSAAIGGWIEQVSLVSQTNGKKYIIGNTRYENDLAENETVSRNMEVTIPSIIGFHGDVKVEISLIAGSEMREPIGKKDNNIDVSSKIKNLLKRLTITLDKNEIIENSKDSLRLNFVRSGSTDLEEEFFVSSDTDNTLNLPVSVKIKKDESSSFLYVNIVDNDIYEGDKVVNVIAKGNGYNDESVNLTVQEDDQVSLSLDYPSNFDYVIGSKIPFTLTSSFPVNQDQLITLSTDLPKRLQLPREVTLLAGSKSIVFDGAITDTGIIEKTDTANVFAKAEGYTTGITDIILSPTNIPTFTLTISPNEVSEGDGIKATYATLKKTDQIDKATTVQISANVNDQLILPSEILFEEGETEKVFNIGTVDNAVVEGNRTLTVTSQVKFDGCSCVDNTSPNTSVNQDILILDNDGLALIVKASPSTIKAGTIENKLTVSRNTEDPSILQIPVTVSLSTDLPNIIELPETVTIPANEKDVEIAFNTIIDPDQESDETVRIEAVASNYATGFGWVLISNQNKPDVLITEITTTTNPEAGNIITVTSLLRNQGHANYPATSKIDYYLSKTKNIGKEEPFVSSILNTVIGVDETYIHEEDIKLPNLSGDYYLIVAINTDFSIGELNYENNQNELLLQLSPAYSIDIELDKLIYTTNETAIVTGTAKTASGNSVPNSDVELKIENQLFKSIHNIKTDANGNFIFEYKPLENENGLYNITAAFPGENIPPQKSFELLGFEVVNKPQYIKWETVVGSSLGNELTLRNNTNTKLTGVSIHVPDDVEFSIDQTPVDIEPGATITFPFLVVPTIASSELKYNEFDMVIQSNEGAKYSELSYYYCKNQEAKLIANPIAVNTTMVKDKSRLYEVSVTNVGAINAENVNVLLPELDWLKLKSQQVIETIKPDEEIKIILEFKPTPKEQVNVPITGNFVLTQDTGAPLSLPFKLETVSESTGTLIIDAVDEYSYNTASAPHLQGAKVVVKHPFTGETIAEGITDASGIFEVPEINEGWYVVNISAEKHTPYQNNILVDPGKETRVSAFLPYQAITYSWDVKETDILDEYEITLTTEFETNVPKPVIVMQIDNPDLDLAPGESRMTYITITNHGLIAANNVSLNVGEIEDYTLKPLITSLDVLNAKSSIIIPVLVKNNEGTGKVAEDSSKTSIETNNGGCTVPVRVRATYICDSEREIFAFSYYLRACSTNNPGGFIPPNGYTTIPNGPGSPISGPSIDLGGSPGSSVKSPIVKVLPGLCNPCKTSITSTVLSCTPGLSVISCIFGLITSKDLSDLILNAALCPASVSGFSCLFSSLNFIKQCIIKNLKSSNKSSNNNVILDYEEDNFDLILEDFEKMAAADEASSNMLSEYFKNPELEVSNENLSLFLEITASSIDSEIALTLDQINSLKEQMLETTITESYINTFVSRWNTTVEAWNADVFSPNTQYPDIVDKTKIDAYKKIKADLEIYAFTRGFVSVADMYNSDIKFIEEFIEEKSQDEASVCATVTMEFPQRLTMTRQAFEGTLKINNSSDKAISQVHLELIVKDENGENKTHLFQINKEDFLNGTGTVNPDTSGQGLAIFIPTKEAAPEVTKSYSFGGILSYFDPEIGEVVKISLNPVTLEVNPSPDLVLHYFMQRDILGDDPLTDDIVEPSLPAELSLMIQNDGYGLAKNVNVESMQPKIVENEKGLLIDFEMIGSNFNNEPTQLGLLNVDFGDIDAKQTAVGQWFFTSSLIGHFVKYDVKVNHKNSYGNENLSLIKGAYIHELIKSVKSYENNSDDIADFLVNDIADVYDTPDMVYLSNGSSEEVSKAESLEFLEQITPSTLTAKIKLNPISTGWNYGNILDEQGKNYKLTKVIRDTDNFEIPLENVWQTQVTLKDGLNPKYEHKLHVLDKVTNVETYTLYFNPVDGDIPKIITFIDPPEQYNTEAVKLINVEFNKEIDFNTFTNANIKLIHQGIELPVDDILIGKINATTFSINIEALTSLSGFYELTVNTIGIKDLVGNEGVNGKKIDWVQFNNELGILKFETDQLKKKPINSITVIFNKPIRAEEFTTDKITINEATANNLTIQKLDDYTYIISGINPLNEVNGDYSISIDVTKIKATDGNPGLISQTYDWIVDNILPKVTNIQTVSQGVSNIQNITGLEIELNRKIVSELEASSFAFFKNGQEISIPIIIQKNDDLHYSVFGLDTYTVDNGTYVLTIDQSNFRDENDNLGEGTAEISWTVKVEPLNAISNLRVTPDLGISNTDNITSGENVQLIYETLTDDITVEVYELLGSSEKLIDTQYRNYKAEYSTPLNNHYGSKKYKVVAYDDFGNRSNAEILAAYIDFTDIVTEIVPINEISDDCTDFDYLEINFAEELSENSFSIDDITLKSNGITIPKNGVTLTQINDKNFILENITNSSDGSIVLEIDKTKISKKISGSIGFEIEKKEIGSPNEYPISVIGNETPTINSIYEYQADDNMNKYDWIIINGEIITTESNIVKVKWNKLGAQSLILRYQTPLNCTLTKTLEVFVDEKLGLENNQHKIDNNFISPVPNNGQFTIHTSIELKDCTLSIFDISGKLVYKENHVNLKSKVTGINLNLESGTYILILHNQLEKLHFKFVIY
ncbi:T9SS type A sorting domain-containing protein [Formosa sp. S-31]|uniref:T9SS type A sorting domain-containing protein n=1 Tax=Formosa sp. S-31 TaxID=2790949 RepID=UPI003EBE7A3F